MRVYLLLRSIQAKPCDIEVNEIHEMATDISDQTVRSGLIKYFKQ